MGGGPPRIFPTAKQRATKENRVNNGPLPLLLPLVVASAHLVPLADANHIYRLINKVKLGRTSRVSRTFSGRRGTVLCCVESNKFYSQMNFVLFLNKYLRIHKINLHGSQKETNQLLTKLKRFQYSCFRSAVDLNFRTTELNIETPSNEYELKYETSKFNFTFQGPPTILLPCPDK